jgi:RNA polymerase sigma-70 factor (ECF subfamily)
VVSVVTATGIRKARAKSPGRFSSSHGSPTMIGRTPDDDVLLARIARSDTGALEMLYDRYGRPVYSLARSLLRDAQAAEEVTQDVFLDIWRAAQTYDAQRGSPRTWILALAHHKSVDALRRRRSAAMQLSETMTGDDPDVADVVAETLRRLEGERVRRALAVLSEEQRTALVLAYYGGYTQREIAERLQVPLGTIKTRMRDGLSRLRSTLPQDIGEAAP